MTYNLVKTAAFEESSYRALPNPTSNICALKRVISVHWLGLIAFLRCQHGPRSPSARSPSTCSSKRSDPDSRRGFHPGTTPAAGAAAGAEDRAVEDQDSAEADPHLRTRRSRRVPTPRGSPGFGPDWRQERLLFRVRTTSGVTDAGSSNSARAGAFATTTTAELAEAGVGVGLRLATAAVER